MLPPIPKKRHRPITETTQGAGALKLIERPRKTVTRHLALTWTWKPDADNPASNVVFLVHSGSLSAPVKSWPVVAVTTTDYWRITTGPTSAFFFVSASNTASRLVSD